MVATPRTLAPLRLAQRGLPRRIILAARLPLSSSVAAAAGALPRPGRASPSALAGGPPRLRSFGTTARSAAEAPKGGKTVVRPFLLADIGEGIAEVEIVKWLVEPGAVVEEFDPVAEVQSDKATVEITSPFEGRIVELCGEVGQTLKVGARLCAIEVRVEGEAQPEEEGDSVEPHAKAHAEGHAGGTQHGAEAAGRWGHGPWEGRVAPEAEAGAEAEDEGGEGVSNRLVHSTPAVRRIAKEHRVDISKVPGTGKEGRVTKEDVLAFLSGPSRPAPCPGTPPASTPGALEAAAVPLSPVKKAMYRSMSASLQIPHFAYSEELDVTPLERLRSTLNASIPPRYRRTTPAADEGGMSEAGDPARVDEDGRFDRITLLSLLIKVLGHAMTEHPLFRSTLSPAPPSSAGSAPADAMLLQRPSCDISLALSTPAGLFTPTIAGVEGMSVYEVASAVARLQSAATRAGPRAAPKFPGQVSGRGGTVTLSNIGIVGGTYTHPVVPPTGQLAIGAVGRVRALPRFSPSTLPLARATAAAPHPPGEPAGGWQVEPRLVVGVSFSADHRVVEGVELARFVQRWKELCEEPGLLVGLGR